MERIRPKGPFIAGIFCILVSFLVFAKMPVQAFGQEAREPVSSEAQTTTLTTDEILEPEVVIEDAFEPPVVYVGKPSMYDSFYNGLWEGVYLFGVAFPFLMVSLLAWIGTILWVPFGVRIARTIVVSRMEPILSTKGETQALEAEPIENGQHKT